MANQAKVTGWTRDACIWGSFVMPKMFAVAAGIAVLGAAGAATAAGAAGAADPRAAMRSWIVG